MEPNKISDYIIEWLISYANKTNSQGFIVGISGGIDSALVSTLVAKTGKKAVLVSMPLQQPADQLVRANNHIEWLKKKYANAIKVEVDLTASFGYMLEEIKTGSKPKQISEVNLKSRLRMCTLYFYASEFNCLVTGTGNKIEDFGIGFFTKYGDGGVDISPIADLTKTEVRTMASYLGVAQDIVQANPTDGLWGEEDRTDEAQIGATYLELEWAMEEIAKGEKKKYNKRQQEVLQIYQAAHKKTLHKITPIPVCHIPKGWK